jgi:putative ABC transport system substrate-binding protein
VDDRDVPHARGDLDRLAEMERVAGVLGVTIQQLAIRRPEEFQVVIDVLRRRLVEGLIVDAAATLYTYQPQIIAAASAHRIPTVFAWPRPVEDGGLLGYGASVPEMYRLAAVYVDKIARGANPADLPVEKVSRYHLAINLKTAELLGLTIPQSLLLQADEVIQ